MNTKTKNIVGLIGNGFILLCIVSFLIAILVHAIQVHFIAASIGLLIVGGIISLVALVIYIGAFIQQIQLLQTEKE